MKLSVFCPACGKKLKVSSEQIGLRLACPRCRQEMVLDNSGTPTLVEGSDDDESGAFCPCKVEPEEDLIDVTAMVDVVFFLLIFFMTTSMHSKQAALDVTRPESSKDPGKGAATAIAVEELDDIIIRVEGDNTVWVNDEFAASRQELLYQLKEASGATPWDVKVQVKANGLAEHGTVVMVLDVGRVVGCKSIQLVTDADL